MGTGDELHHSNLNTFSRMKDYEDKSMTRFTISKEIRTQECDINA